MVFIQIKTLDQLWIMNEYLLFILYQNLDNFYPNNKDICAMIYDKDLFKCQAFNFSLQWIYIITETYDRLKKDKEKPTQTWKT